MGFIERIANALGGLSHEEKAAEYEKLCDGEPDALYVLSKGVIAAGTIGRPRSKSYRDLDIHGAQGAAMARTVAAAELHGFFPEAEVIATSNVKKEPLNYARVTAEEFKRMGISDEKVVIQEDSYSTYTEIVEMMKMALARKWRHIAIVVNTTQMERAKAFVEHAGDLRDPNGYWKGVQDIISEFKRRSDIKVSYVSAEDVLSFKSPRHKRLVEAAMKMPEWQNTMDRENEGARQIRAGEYWKGKEPETTVKQ